jgi:chromosome segregation ATPase
MQIANTIEKWDMFVPLEDFEAMQKKILDLETTTKAGMDKYEEDIKRITDVANQALAENKSLHLDNENLRVEVNNFQKITKEILDKQAQIQEEAKTNNEHFQQALTFMLAKFKEAEQEQKELKQRIKELERDNAALEASKNMEIAQKKNIIDDLDGQVKDLSGQLNDSNRQVYE